MLGSHWTGVVSEDDLCASSEFTVEKFHPRISWSPVLTGAKNLTPSTDSGSTSTWWKWHISSGISSGISRPPMVATLMCLSSHQVDAINLISLAGYSRRTVANHLLLNITQHHHTVALTGESRLERVDWREQNGKTRESKPKRTDCREQTGASGTNDTNLALSSPTTLIRHLRVRHLGDLGVRFSISSASSKPGSLRIAKKNSVEIQSNFQGSIQLNSPERSSPREPCWIATSDSLAKISFFICLNLLKTRKRLGEFECL